ncbi:MAG: protein kinase [Chloroflexota bacterium]
MQGTDPLIGQTIDGYDIQSLLGHGGMGRVYQALDITLNRYAALKVMSHPTHKAELYKKRFDREAQSIAKLKHPNIVAIYRFNRTDDFSYMAMEFVDGADLRWVLRDYASNGELIDYKTLYDIINQIAKALDYAHKNGVIHRDIKPSNIMIARDGAAILTDFGLALDTNEGTLGEAFGSPHYIAPEQAVNSAKAVPQTDIYSLGVVLYEMLTGSMPFTQGSALQVAMAHISDTLPDPLTINPKLHQAFLPVLDKVLEKDPSDRYQTAAALVADLKKAIQVAQKSKQAPTTSTHNPATRIQRQLSPLPQPAVSMATKPPTMILDAPRPNPDLPPTQSMANPPAPPKKRGSRVPLLLLLLVIVLGGISFVFYDDLLASFPPLQSALIQPSDNLETNTYIEGVVSEVESGDGYLTMTIYGVTVQVDRAHPLYLQTQAQDTVLIEGNAVTVQSGILRFRQIERASHNGEPIIIETEEPSDG